MRSGRVTFVHAIVAHPSRGTGIFDSETAPMAYTCERPDYRLRVEGGFEDRERWTVFAVLEYRRSLGMESRRRTEAEARLELMVGISRECGFGRERGAKHVTVMVQGDPEIADFFEARDARVSPFGTV